MLRRRKLQDFNLYKTFVLTATRHKLLVFVSDILFEVSTRYVIK